MGNGTTGDPALEVPGPEEGIYPPRVMVPGAGLGRLVMECARLGFDTEGNEYSYYMLLTSSYILNHARRAGQFVIHPWMHNNNNHLSDADQLRATPAGHTGPLPSPPQLRMSRRRRRRRRRRLLYSTLSSQEPPQEPLTANVRTIRRL